MRRSIPQTPQELVYSLALILYFPYAFISLFYGHWNYTNYNSATIATGVPLDNSIHADIL